MPKIHGTKFLPREKNKALYEINNPLLKEYTMLKKAIVTLVLATGIAALAKLVINHTAETS